MDRLFSAKKKVMNGHGIYWLDSQGVSVKRHIVFDGEVKPSKPPLVSTETSRLLMSTKIIKNKK